MRNAALSSDREPDSFKLREQIRGSHSIGARAAGATGVDSLMSERILRRVSLIAGEPVSPEGGDIFRAFDPIAGEVIDPAYVSANDAQVEQAAKAAWLAFRDYSRRSGQERAQFLRCIANGIESLGTTLIERAGRETGLPSAHIESERARTCMQLRMFAQLAAEATWIDARCDSADALRKPQPKPQISSLLRPLGPVTIFGASNFPLAFSVAGGDTAAAFAAGCTVIIKAQPAHPGTSELIGNVINDAVEQCHLPKGVFSLLFDAGHEVGLALVRHRLIKAAAFTGSRNGGLTLWRAAQDRVDPIPFFAEMSSINPMFILPAVMRTQSDTLATGLHTSMVLGVGQFCTQPGLIFIPGDESADELLHKLARLVRDTPAGMMLTPAISERYVDELAARCAFPAVSVLALAAAPNRRSQAVAALLATDTAEFLQNARLREELFGPCSLVIRCAAHEDFARCAEQLEGQLTATVWGGTAELAEQSELLWLLEQKAGRVIVNDFPTGVEVGAATVHGGPFPATTDSRFSSVGARSIARFVRPVAYQNFPPELLPPELRTIKA